MQDVSGESVGKLTRIEFESERARENMMRALKHCGPEPLIEVIGELVARLVYLEENMDIAFRNFDKMARVLKQKGIVNVEYFSTHDETTIKKRGGG